MIIGLRGGHCSKVRGAVGFVDEYDQMQLLYAEVEALLIKAGHEIINCNTNASSQNEDLKLGVQKANAKNVQLFISLHMNAFNGSAQGVEAWTYSSESRANSYAKNICNGFAKLGFTNRGLKHSSNYYEMKNAKAPNIIVETCFCDSKKDTDRLKQLGISKLAFVIANAIDSSIKEDTPVISNEIYRIRTSWNDTRSQVGAFSDLENAKECCNKNIGTKVFNKAGDVVYTGKEILTGSKVKITGTKYATGENISSWALDRVHTVKKIDSSKALLNEINSWVYLKDLAVI